MIIERGYDPRKNNIYIYKYYFVSYAPILVLLRL